MGGFSAESCRWHQLYYSYKGSSNGILDHCQRIEKHEYLLASISGWKPLLTESTLWRSVIDFFPYSLSLSKLGTRLGMWSSFSGTATNLLMLGPNFSLKVEKSM